MVCFPARSRAKVTSLLLGDILALLCARAFDPPSKNRTGFFACMNRLQLHACSTAPRNAAVSRSFHGLWRIYDAELEKVNGVLRALKLEGRDDIVLIDANRDNKPSGSKT